MNLLMVVLLALMVSTQHPSQTIDRTHIVVLDSKNFKPWLKGKYKPAQLSEKEINEVEAIIKRYVSKDQTTPPLDSLSEYYQQLTPARNAKGEKIVWVNCSCELMDGWQTTPFLVMDGGICFFQLKINMRTKKVYDFMVNGYATSVPDEPPSNTTGR